MVSPAGSRTFILSGVFSTTTNFPSARLPTSQRVETKTLAWRKSSSASGRLCAFCRMSRATIATGVAVSPGRLEGAPLIVTETPARFMPDTTPAMLAHASEINGMPWSGSLRMTTRSRLKTSAASQSKLRPVIRWPPSVALPQAPNAVQPARAIKRVINHHVGDVMGGVVIEQAVVVIAEFRVQVRAAENRAVNLQTIIVRDIIAQFAVAEDDIGLQHLDFPILRHVAVDHVEEFILQRVHLLRQEYAGGIAHLERRAFEPDDEQSLAARHPGLAEPGLAVAQLRFELHDRDVRGQRWRFGRPTAHEHRAQQPAAQRKDDRADQNSLEPTFHEMRANCKIASPAGRPVTENKARN